MVTKRESIQRFLQAKARPDLAALYNAGMEVQVNVAQDNGELIQGEYNGHQWRGWTDGSQTWKPIRIPFASMSEPHYEDSQIKFDLAAHADGIGMTGYDFANHRSIYCAYDFDAIAGHSEKHAKKLSEQELSDVQRIACEIPWVTVRQSTSGNGLHLYVFLDFAERVANHSEHAAIARAILGKISAITGYDFNAKVDNCFSGDTEFLTESGVRTFRDAVGEKVRVLQLTPEGERWVDAEVKSFGFQQTRTLYFGNNSELRCTDNHKWLWVDYKNRVSLYDKKSTAELTKNTRLPLAKQDLPLIDWAGFAHGYVFGDGWEADSYGKCVTNVAIFGESSELLEKLAPFGRSVGSAWRGQQRVPMVYGLPGSWKQLPVNPTKEYAFGCIMGLHAADGKMGNKGGISIQQSDFEIQKAVQKLALWVGLRAREPRLEEPSLGQYENAKPAYRVHIETYNMTPEMFVRLDHRKKFVRTNRQTTSVVLRGKTQTEEVFCVIAPGYNNFTLANGVVTSNCGGNIWVWHRKYEKVGGVGGPGLKLIKQGGRLSDVPINWRDHVRVTSGARKRSKPGFVAETELDPFEEMCSQHPKVPLDDQHRKLIDFLESNGAMWWFDNDHHMLVCHTYDLLLAHKALGMRGIFKTTASGKEHGADQNCFAYPQRRGAWVVRRHTKGVGESDTWEQDSSGYTRCFLNKEPDLKTAARGSGGVENDKGAFVFRSAEQAMAAAQALGVNIDLPNFVAGRQAKLKPHKDGRLIFEIERQSGDSTEKMSDWIEEKGNVWKRVINTQVTDAADVEIRNYDDIVRHLITIGGEDWGWVIKSDSTWCREPLAHVKAGLTAFGISPKDVSLVIGSMVVKRWTIVNEPFQPEYLGDRQWNRNAAQLAFAPSLDVDHTKYPTWKGMLEHCGAGLNEAISRHPWCKENGIKTGGEYLMLWIASLFQAPKEHLPYLFFYSRGQATGKTTFADALSMLMTQGVERADAALINQSGFNGELESKVLCIVEETDLRHNKGQAYNRIKDWVTNDKIGIHGKNKQPYTVINTTHWIHNSNDPDECPIFAGDTRITMCAVPPLTKIDRDFMDKLRKEAPDFLAAVLAEEIPPSCDRHNVPVIETEDKARAQELTKTELEQFLEDKTHPIDGEWIKCSDLHEHFQEWLDADRVSVWSIIKMNRELIRLGFAKGRNTKDGQHYVGNISFTPPPKDAKPKPRLVLDNQMLVPEGTGNGVVSKTG